MNASEGAVADLRLTLPTPTVPDPARQARLIGNGFTVVLPWWPDDITHAQLASQWIEQPRPGRDPLLLRESTVLEELSIGFVLVNRSRLYVEDAGDVDATLAALRIVAVGVAPVQLLLASRDTGRWRVINFDVTELDHSPLGLPLKVDVNIILKRAQDASAPIGPVPARKPTKKRK